MAISKERRREINRDWFRRKQASDPDYHKRLQKDYSKRNPDSVRLTNKKAYLKSQYGISIEEYDAMVARAEGRCEICDKLESDQKSPLAIDHCHKTGKVRGLLCVNCNTAIGLLKEDFGIIDKLVAYLKK